MAFSFWSGTDQNEIEAWKNDSWSIALVVNLKQEYKLNISVWDPIKVSEDVPLEIIRPVPKPTAKQKKQYEELCSTANPIGNHTTYTIGKGWTSNSKVSNKNQTSFLQNKVETVLNWKNSQNIIALAELIENLDNDIDELISSAIAGEISYELYAKEVENMNKMLLTRNAKIKVITIAKGKLLEKGACMQPWEHIKYENNEIEKAYDNARVQQYNLGYNIGGYLC